MLESFAFPLGSNHCGGCAGQAEAELSEEVLGLKCKVAILEQELQTSQQVESHASSKHLPQYTYLTLSERASESLNSFQLITQLALLMNSCCLLHGLSGRPCRLLKLCENWSLL